MRKSGILLHISSLPSPYGIGTMGKKAYEFIDFLKKSGQKYWQVLPLGPTSYGDSPYQTFSVFAGNPYFIDLDNLIEEGFLVEKDLEFIKQKQDNNRVDYQWLYNTRFLVLKKAYDKFLENEDKVIYNLFIKENAFWLDDYALFMAIKNRSSEGNWHSWEKKYAFREDDALNEFKFLFDKDINFWKFIQFEFFKQWRSLKKYANNNGIKIIGDMPIYVAYDSSDVWSNPRLWQLDENLEPVVVAGCPPDYFAKYGQLWGNPIYDYNEMSKDGYSWWIRRIKETFKNFDVVRIDHFRGFEAYYAIPYKNKTAEFGNWVKGPGYDIFKCIKEKLGELDIIAEDLGFLTEEVHKLLDKTGYPGMKILQFAFSPYEDNLYLPHNHTKNSVCYTGTHDNMTLKEWINQLSFEEKKFCYDYIGIDNDEEAVDKIIKCCLASVSNIAIIPMSDYLELGTEGRFNIPSTLGGNWTWRMSDNSITADLIKRIYYNTNLYRR